MLGELNDVWTLGASLLDLGFDAALDPLVGEPGGPRPQAGDGTGTKFALYTAWHAAVVAGRDAPAWHGGRLPDALARQIAESAAPCCPRPPRPRLPSWRRRPRSYTLSSSTGTRATLN